MIRKFFTCKKDYNAWLVMNPFVIVMEYAELGNDKVYVEYIPYNQRKPQNRRKRIWAKGDLHDLG